MSTKGTAVITGASSGIGAIYAERLAARGHDVILVARNAERLAQQAERIGERHGVSVRVFNADLTDAAQLRQVEALLRDDDTISVLVNNAGFGGAGPLLQSDVDRMEEMVAINVTAVLRLTYAVVPRFVARGAGTIINISSIVAIGPEILTGSMGAPRPSCSASASRSRRNSPAPASACRWCCRAPPPPPSGMPPACPSTSCRRPG